MSQQGEKPTGIHPGAKNTKSATDSSLPEKKNLTAKKKTATNRMIGSSMHRFNLVA